MMDYIGKSSQQYLCKKKTHEQEYPTHNVSTPEKILQIKTGEVNWSNI